MSQTEQQREKERKEKEQQREFKEKCTNVDCKIT